MGLVSSSSGGVAYHSASAVAAQPLRPGDYTREVLGAQTAFMTRVAAVARAPKLPARGAARSATAVQSSGGRAVFAYSVALAMRSTWLLAVSADTPAQQLLTLPLVDGCALHCRFDDRTWYPLGRVIGGTVYPVSPPGWQQPHHVMQPHPSSLLVLCIVCGMQLTCQQMPAPRVASAAPVLRGRCTHPCSCAAVYALHRTAAHPSSGGSCWPVPPALHI